MKTLLKFIYAFLIAGAIVFWIIIGTFDTIPNVARFSTNSALGNYQYGESVDQIGFTDLAESKDRTVVCKKSIYLFVNGQWELNSETNTSFAKKGSNSDDLYFRINDGSGVYKDYHVQNKKTQIKTSLGWEDAVYEANYNPVLINARNIDIYDNSGNIFGASLLLDESKYYNCKRKFKNIFIQSKDEKGEASIEIDYIRIKKLDYTSYKYDEEGKLKGKFVYNYQIDYSVDF